VQTDPRMFSIAYILPEFKIFREVADQTLLRRRVCGGTIWSSIQQQSHLSGSPSLCRLLSGKLHSLVLLHIEASGGFKGLLQCEGGTETWFQI
jgi:hypothetical protein